MGNELWMHLHADDQQAAVNGVVIINDIGGADGATMLKQLPPPSFLKKTMVVFQDAYPGNPKENHMLNMPPMLEKVCDLMISFANQKLRARTRFHAKGNGMEQLHEALGTDVLPEEYGGTAGPIQSQIDE